jgi:hypothetical protein
MGADIRERAHLDIMDQCCNDTILQLSAAQEKEMADMRKETATVDKNVVVGCFCCQIYSA